MGWECGEYMINYKMKITPAIPVEIRHKIEKLLLLEGYYIIGAGGYVDDSSCDISFSTKEKKYEVPKKS